MVLLITDPQDRQRLLTVTERPWDRRLARLMGTTLDRQLAAGHPPEASRLLAVRARELASWEARSSLARHWENLLAVVGRRRAHVPLCRRRIDGAAHDVREMVDALVVPLPTPARGVAMASLLLTDGTGPLYNHDSAVDLHAALREVTVQLDPATSLVPAPPT
jgi:hypothetical protein